MSFSFERIYAAVGTGGVRLTAEMAGYLALAAATAVGSNERTSSGEFFLESSGGVTSEDGRIRQPAELAIRTMLGAMLRFATSENLALEDCARGGSAGLGRLIQELEAALVPINRQAARRGLCRLYRNLAACPESAFEFRQVVSPAKQEPQVAVMTAVPPPPRRAPTLLVPRPIELGATPILGTQVTVIPAAPWQVGDETPFSPPVFEEVSERRVSRRVPSRELHVLPATEIEDHAPLRSNIMDLLAQFAQEGIGEEKSA